MPDQRIGRRYIDGDRLLQAANAAGDQKLIRWLRRQPRVPVLVNSAGAAKLLGRLPNHMSRLKHRLNPVAVEGTDRPLYIKSEILELAKELKKEKG